MVTQQQALVTALNLIDHAAELLNDIGDNASSQRLRHTAAVIRNDGKYTPPDGLEVPLAFMRMALALIDRDGDQTGAGLHLQAAVDVARQAVPLEAGEEVDLDLIAAYIHTPPRLREAE